MSTPMDTTDSGASGSNAATADLSLIDSILEPTVSASLDQFLLQGGAPKKAVKLLSENYKGRAEMINLVGGWMDIALGTTTTTPTTSAPSPPPSLPPSHAFLHHAVQRNLIRRFSTPVADAILASSAQQQPLWLEEVISTPSFAPVFEELYGRHSDSLFLKLCLSLIAQRKEDMDATGGGVKTEAGLQSSSTGSTVNSIVTSTVRAQILNEFETAEVVISRLLHRFIDRCIERGSGTMDIKTTSFIKLESASSATNDLLEKIQSMDLTQLHLDLIRLGSASEYCYLFAQRLLLGLEMNTPKEHAYIFQRLEQDLRQYAISPPTPSTLSSAHLTSAASERNPNVVPLDVFLLGLKEEWQDVGQILINLYRTETIASSDVSKLYLRYSPSASSLSSSSVEVPPVALIRNRLLISVLLQALFGKDSKLQMTDPPAAFFGSATPIASERDKYVFLLAYATSVRDERRTNVQLQKQLDSITQSSTFSATFGAAALTASSSMIDKTTSFFESTRSALQRLHDLIMSSMWGLKPNSLIRHIHAHMSSPVVAAAATMWMGVQLTDISFYDSTYHTTVTPYFLNFLGEFTNRYPLLRSKIFHILRTTFHLNPPSMDPFASIQFKKLLLNLFLHLIHVGYHLQEIFLLLMNEINEKGMDQSLIRHFVVQLIFTTGGLDSTGRPAPYSRQFLEGVLDLLGLPQTFRALKSMLLDYFKNSTTASSTSTHHTSAKAAQVLAAAHVAPHTKAALRVLAAAELHGELPPATPTPKVREGEGNVIVFDVPKTSTAEPSDSQPPAKKIKTENGSSASAAAGMTKEEKEEKEERRRKGVQEPKPLAAVGSNHDGSDRIFVDFCTLLHSQPSILRDSPLVGSLIVDEFGVIQREDSSLKFRETTPMDSAAALSGQFTKWLSVVGSLSIEPKQTRVRAIISPHAGYSYSGPTAAYGFKHMNPADIKRIFILGPSHHHYTKICELSRHALYSTPISPLQLDTQVIATLRASKAFQDMSTQVDEEEHSIEMQLPFLAHIMASAKQAFTIVPILVGSLSVSKEKEFGELLAPYLAASENFFVISSDFCHWGSRFRFQYTEPSKPIHEAIDHLDHVGMELIEKQDADGFAEYLEKYENTICGRHPIGVLLRMLQKLSTIRHTVKFIHYAQSSRVTKVSESSVSYASAIITTDRT